MTYRRNGKEVLHGAMHVADCATESIAALIVLALNEWVEKRKPPAPDVFDAVPDDDGVRHNVRQEGDEYACSCGARWDVKDEDDHP